MARILAFAGGARANSYNHRLVGLAASAPNASSASASGLKHIAMQTAVEDLGQRVAAFAALATSARA